MINAEDISGKQGNDIAYKVARGNDNPRVRQGFLDGLDLGDATPYVLRVVYEPRSESFIEEDGSVLHPDTAHMLTRPPESSSPSFLRRVFGEKTRRGCTVKVYRGAFDKCINLDEFLSGLIDHEGYHAIEHATGRTEGELEENERKRRENPNNPFGYSDPRELSIQSEIRARENQLRIIKEGKRNCSPEFVRTLEEEVRQLYLESVA